MLEPRLLFATVHSPIKGIIQIGKNLSPSPSKRQRCFLLRSKFLKILRSQCFESLSFCFYRITHICWFNPTYHAYDSSPCSVVSCICIAEDECNSFKQIETRYSSSLPQYREWSFISLVRRRYHHRVTWFHEQKWKIIMNDHNNERSWITIARATWTK